MQKEVGYGRMGGLVGVFVTCLVELRQSSGILVSGTLEHTRTHWPQGSETCCFFLPEPIFLQGDGGP